MKLNFTKYKRKLKNSQKLNLSLINKKFIDPKPIITTIIACKPDPETTLSFMPHTSKVIISHTANYIQSLVTSLFFVCDTIWFFSSKKKQNLHVGEEPL